MIKPNNLRERDRIGIIAPARKVSPDQISEAIHVLKNWGLDVVEGKYLFADSHPYLGATDDQRRADFQNFIDDDSIKAIVSARGGYGCTRIVDALDFSPLVSKPKWIVGFSDMTAVHLSLLKREIISIHGTMPLLFASQGAELSVESLRRILFDGHHAITFDHQPMNRIGRCEGKIVGGNLSLIVDSIGTSSEPDLDHCILVLEEIDEYRYKIDRMLMQLKRAGKLSNLAALLVGHFTDVKDSSLPFGESVSDMILRVAKDYDFPIGFNFPCGHENPNLAFMHGALYELTVNINDSKLISRSMAL